MSPPVVYEEWAECRMPADLHCVFPVLEIVRNYCYARGLRPSIWSEVELAVAEGLNNAIEHGCAGKESAEARIRWNWHDETLQIEIRDPGDYAPCSTEAKLPEDLLAEGGRGAFLMAQLMDRVEHTSSENGHLLLMEKKVGLATWTVGNAAEMEATIESMAEDLSRSYEDLSALFRFAEELATSTTLAEFIEHSLSRLLTLVSGHAAYVRLLSPNKNSLDLLRTTVSDLTWPAQVLKLEAGGVETSAFTQRSTVTVEDCSALSKDDPLARCQGAAVICPIFFRSKTLGCLVVTQRPKVPYFSAGELGLIRVVADFLGIVRTTNTLQEQRQAQQRAARELEIAAAIQQSLLPQTFPDDASYRIFGVCQSAQEVGGDYFDALNLGTQGVLLVIADVMGKGVPAALLATILRTAIHARLDLATDPARLLTKVNHQIASDLAQIDMFITAQVAYLSRADNTLLVTNAGHCPLLHCQTSRNRLLQIKGGGIPLGVLDGFEYEQQRFTVEPGDRFVFLTDGLYEVENMPNQMLGIDALARHISTLAALAPMDFCAQTLDFVRKFSGAKAASDDRTLLTLERLRTT
jgi:serine phosphatase RsbU (regulator of sigma subunit)/anti-sigma regulatory factor (Ser/Thr protein kinase)